MEREAGLQAGERRSADPVTAPAGPAVADVSARLLALQRTAGNQAVGRLLARDAAPAAPPAAADPLAIADEVYAALDGWNDEPRAIRALTGHDAATRARIKEEFRHHGSTLDAYLKDQLDGDYLVQAFALLESSNVHEPHTRLALALIPTGTRDDELMRLLEGVDHAHRLQIQERYNAAFASIGQGSLDADLKDDLSGWRLEKCLALMNRDLTRADHLYFLSLAITGTHTDSVVALIQEEWGRGPAAFRQLETDWNRYVKSGDGQSGGWTDMTLRAAMESELSGEPWEMVRAVLDGYDQLAGAAGGGAIGQDQDVRDDVELRVAEQTLTAATTGGYTGAGTNEAQVYAAVQRIREIWQRRIDRAPEPRRAELRRQWEERRGQLAALAADEMDTDGAEYQRTRLLLSGALTPADEVWLASRELDNDKVIRALTQAWQTGGMNTLLTQAGEPRMEGTTELRPRFNVLFTVPVTSGTPWARVNAISRSDHDDTTRGVNRVKLELDEGDNDSDLRRAYEVLSGASSTLRAGVVAQYASTYLGDVEGATPTAKFLAHIGRRYENSTAVWDFTDLLDPATRPEQMVDRARGRLDASRSGVFDADLEEWIRDYDAITGEDTLELAQESLARLEWMARRARPHELAAIAALTGQNIDQLARLEYGEFQRRLQEVQSLKQAIAEAIATAGELAISAVLTVASGGAAAGLFAAALSSAVAGMVVREALLGQQYDLISRENAARLAGVVAGAGLGALGGELFQTAVSAERLQQLTRIQTFMQEVTQEAFSQVGTAIATQAFSDKVPSAEDMAAGAITMLGSIAGAGTRGALRWSPTQAAPQVRTLFLSNLAQATVSQTSEQFSELARSGTGDFTGPEIAGQFLRRAASALQQSLVQTVGDAGAHEVAAAREGADPSPHPATDDPAAPRQQGEPAPDADGAVPHADDGPVSHPGPAPVGEREPAPVGAVRGPTYEQAPRRQLGGRRFQEDMERLARARGRARDATVAIQAPPDGQSARMRMTVTRADGTAVDVDVTIRPRPGGELPEGSHGAESGPARYELHPPEGDQTAWRAEVSVDQATYRDDLHPMVGHELDEIADILYAGADSREAMATQQRASVFRPDAEPGAAPSAHDRATARELFRLNEDMQRLRDGLEGARRGNDDRTGAIEDWDARLRRRIASMDRLMDSMGLTNPDAMDAKIQTLRDVASTPEWNEFIEQVQVFGARPMFDAMAAGAPAGAQPALDLETVAHLAYPNPHAPTSGPESAGVFRDRGIVGGHDARRLREFVDQNPRYRYVLVEEGRRAGGGTEFVSYAQYMWTGTPETMPRPGDANYPVRGGATPAGWARADDPKTVAEDFGAFLREAEAAFRSRPPGPPAADRSWTALSPGAVQISGFLDPNDPNRAATAFIEDEWVRGGGGAPAGGGGP